MSGESKVKEDDKEMLKDVESRFRSLKSRRHLYDESSLETGV